MSASRPGPLALALAALVALFLVLPLVAVVPVSFTPARFLSIPKGEWSLTHYRALLENPDWLRSILLSLEIGIVASVAATVLGTLFALGIWMARPWFAGLLVGFVVLPMIVPPVVSAMSLYFLLTSLSQVSAAIGYDSLGGVALAHVVMIVPFAVVMVLVALAGVDRRIDLAARSLGASLSTRVFRVILPNVRFGVLVAWLLSFVLSWEEIGVTLFVTSVDAITLPRLMWMGVRDNIDPAIASISVVLIALTALVLLVRALVERRMERRARS